MSTTSWAASALLGLFAWVACGAAYADVAAIDRTGRINAMTFDGEQVDVQTDIRVPLAGWGSIPNMSQARNVQFSEQGGKRTWTGRIDLGGGKAYTYQEAVSEAKGAVELDLRVTAEAEAEIEGVYLWLDVPIMVFAGGECALAEGGQAGPTAEMPRERPQNRHFLNGSGDRLTMTDAAGKTSLTVALDRPCPITVQDNREWQGSTYSAFIQVARGALAVGQSASLRATLTLTGEPDTTPARLSVDATRVRYQLDGFGGNYCFNIESPVTQYTLDSLHIAWARTEMTPAEWEPENDNESPTDTNWALLESHDTPDSNLRREFLLAKQIQERGIPYVISIWHLPEWLYADPGKGPDAHRRRVDPGKWPELLECLGSYLVYAKRQYGVEPDLFCFNEANIGVRVLFSPEEHREAIKAIGAHFRKLGLKTKMLLADATGPQGTDKYALPAAADPEAMQYVGAVGFHSWGGATPEGYGAWADLAERLKLPLLVTELGVDAGAWRGRTYDSFQYGLREIRMYQEILLYARPQGTMQWEFTSDYGIVKEERGAPGEPPKLVPTQRFWLVKHFCNLTPHGSDALTTASDHPRVLFTAFAGPVAGTRAYTLHVANLGPGRHATIAGVPKGIQSLRAIRTTESEAFVDLPPVPVRDGVAETDLAQQSLLTLTTVPAE